MCGRYALARPARELASLFDAAEAPGFRETYEPSHNLAPTRLVAGLAMPRDGDRVLDTYRWGLVPAWAEDPSIGGRLFNARAATLATSRAFSDAFEHRRLVVLADGFFEWQAGPDGRRRPLLFRRADGRPLALAGLWDRWRDRSHGRPEPVQSCTIVTTEAGPDVADVHDRMPVVLEDDALDRWLDPRRCDVHRAATLLHPSPAGTLVRHPVDPRVGDVRNDGPELVEPYEERELRLFD
jgi:putative SOS response-associated peptidase YedK